MTLLKKLTIVALTATATLADQDFQRFLQSNSKKDLPKVYGDNAKIPFKAQLGCGACIRGGYIFCIPGAEGSEPSTWGSNKPNCCQNSTSCPELSNTAYTCSNKYTDPTQAKGMCPFRKNQCGNATAFAFSAVGQNQTISINLTEGETCTYLVQADCGLPSIAPNDTTGFDIETLDYDEDDLKTLRVLQQGKGDDKDRPRDISANASSIPRPPKNKTAKKNEEMKDKKKENKNGTEVAEKEVGPRSAKFDPSTGEKKLKFKGGAKNGETDAICKKRWSQISVTALGNLTTSARLLQAASSDVFTMTLEIGASDFNVASESSSAVMIKACAALVLGLIAFLA